ncbi:hypothetical protein LOD99_3546 [Oopsacas minuta]|uniref:Uncharacterized protein n=1 Tax=Oopsacas minuta TaxID=111878 RepID=A0AAV7K056_9METZ|nr:hypothetical protein LOD99_3546 [Oopsacas minuta]
MAKQTKSVLTQSGVLLEVIGSSTIKSQAVLILGLSNLTFEFVNGDRIDISLRKVENIRFHQPIFGASYISALWVGEGKVSISFKEGGGAVCFEKLSEYASRAIGDSMLSTTQIQSDSISKKMQ